MAARVFPTFLTCLPKFTSADVVKSVGIHSSTKGNKLDKGYKFFRAEFIHNYQGVFGVYPDPVDFKSVTEGDSVTLYTDQNDIQRYKEVLWTFGDHDHCIAEINKVKYISETKDFREMFTNKLKLDGTTGSLTITNIEFKNSGPYKLRLVDSKRTSEFKFNITVYARLPVPVIFSKVSSQCSSSSVSKCVLLLCSSVNVKDTTDVSVLLKL